MSYKYKPNRHAALIVFKCGTTEEEIKAVLSSIEKITSSAEVENYDDEESEPHLYFP